MCYNAPMSKSVKTHKKTASLARKKAFVAAGRKANYRASLRLEGYSSDDLESDSGKPVTKQEVINRYRLAVS